jgi:ubiquinone/menaquinone biosynthesis C-methylase UbiE
MNINWSTYLQKANTLYKTRQLRFDDRFSHLYKTAFDIDNKQTILEIGAGPGALTQALYKWYPKANVIGSDRDTNFIEFAKSEAPYLEFLEADATSLPFSDNSFDVTISHTVQEHISPEKFFSEQYRVLKPDGVCLVLSSRTQRAINIISETIASSSTFEKEMCAKTDSYYKATDEKYAVCSYPMTEKQLPQEMEKYGFRDVSTHYITINLTPDSSDTDDTFAKLIFEASRQVHLDSLPFLPDIAPNVVTEEEFQKWVDEINCKYDKRIEQYKNAHKQWDTNVSVIMVIRGRK